jgi:hypothetical protein
MEQVKTVSGGFAIDFIARTEPIKMGAGAGQGSLKPFRRGGVAKEPQEIFKHLPKTLESGGVDLNPESGSGTGKPKPLVLNGRIRIKIEFCAGATFFLRCCSYWVRAWG